MQTHGHATKTKSAGVAAKSRLYWELKAEQVLNRIFEQYTTNHELSGSESCSNEFTDVEVINFTPARKPDPPLGAADTKIRIATIVRPILALSLTGMTALALTALIQTSRQQHALKEANNLQLLNQLRQYSSRQENHHIKNSDVRSADSNIVPPSPPSEDWIQELGKLPASDGSHPELLKVPLRGDIASTLPIQGKNTTSPRSGSSSGNSLPLLLGVIQGVGKSGAAIMQWEGNATSFNSGETIGTSGWRLRETNADSAVIERGGQQQRISINNGN